MEAGKLTVRHILSVRCPMCRAKPNERCTLTTGHPSEKTHLAREQAAAKVPPPESGARAAARSLQRLARGGWRALFKRN